MLYRKICKEHERLQSEISRIQSEINKLPNGTLIVAKNGEKYYKWYAVDENGKKFIPKKERQEAEKLAYKKYLMIQVKAYEKELKAYEAYLKQHDEYMFRKEQELLENPEFQELITKIYKPMNIRQREWMNELYKRNEYHSENLKYRTRSGIRVRSKSELLITMVLNKYGIIPSINLITTYETEDCPLDETMIENLVRYYFL